MPEHKPKTAALIAYAEGLLSEDGQRRLETHLEACEVCQAELAAMELYDSMIDSVHSTEVPKIDFDSMSMTLSREAMSLSRELKAQQAEKSRARYVVPAAAVALAAAALLAIWAWPDEPTPRAERPSPPTEEPAPIEAATLSPVVTLAAGEPRRVDGDVARVLAVGDAVPEGTDVEVANGELHVRLSEGTGFAAYSETELTLTRARSDEVRIALETGAVGQRVAPLGEAQRYRVQAGEYEVEVRGTRFVVSNREGVVGVDLSEGSVVVRWPDHEVILHAPARWRSSGARGDGDPEPVAVRELTPVDEATDVRFHHPEVVRWRFDETTLTAGGPVALRAAPGDYELMGWDPSGHLLRVALTVGDAPVEIEPDALEPETPRIRPGHLDPEDLRPVTERGRPRIEQCYEAALRRGSTVTGRVRLRVHLAVDGSVRRAQVIGMSGDGAAELSRCIVNYATHWSFPPPGGPFRFDLPLNFSPIQ